MAKKNGINNLRPIVANDQNNWRAQNVPPHIRDIVLKHFSEDMNLHDAAALFWFVRNIFFFELELDKRSDISIIKYEDLVQYPFEVMEEVYRKIGFSFPGEKLVKDVKVSSIGKGSQVTLSKEIEWLCNGLLEKLDSEYNRTGIKPFNKVESSTC